MPGGGFIWPEANPNFFLKRDKSIIRSILRSEGLALGFVGSDVLGENPEPAIAVSELMPVTNESGQRLRFALLGRDTAADRDKVDKKIANEEPLVAGTSYPRLATKTLGGLGIRNTIPPDGIEAGCIEGLLWERPWLDVAFELVQTGKSVAANRERILQDSLLPVTLLKIERRASLDGAL